MEIVLFLFQTFDVTISAQNIEFLFLFALFRYLNSFNLQFQILKRQRRSALRQGRRRNCWWSWFPFKFNITRSLYFFFFFSFLTWWRLWRWWGRRRWWWWRRRIFSPLFFPWSLITPLSVLPFFFFFFLDFLFLL